MSLNPKVDGYHILEDYDDEVTHPFFVKKSSKSTSRKRSSPKAAPSISSGRSDSGYSSFTNRTRSSAGSELSFASAPQPATNPFRRSSYVTDTQPLENIKQPMHSDDDSHAQAGARQVRFELGRTSQRGPEASRRKRATEREGILDEQCTRQDCTTCSAQPGRSRLGPPTSYLMPSRPLGRHESSQPYSQQHHDQAQYAPPSYPLQGHGYGYNTFPPWPNVHHPSPLGPLKRRSPEPRSMMSEPLRGQNSQRRASYIPTALEYQSGSEANRNLHHFMHPGGGTREDEWSSGPSSEKDLDSTHLEPPRGIERGNTAQYETRMREIRLLAQAKEKVKFESSADRYPEADKRKRYSSRDRRIPNLPRPPISPRPYDDTMLHSYIERPQSTKQTNLDRGRLKPPNNLLATRTTSRNFSLLDNQSSKYFGNAIKVLYDEAAGVGHEKTTSSMHKDYPHTTSDDFLERGAIPRQNVGSIDEPQVDTIVEEKVLSSPVGVGHSEESFDDYAVDVDEALDSAMVIVKILLLRELFDYALPDATEALHGATTSTSGNSRNTGSARVSSFNTIFKPSSQGSKRLRESGHDPGDGDGDNSDDDDDRPKKRPGKGFPDRFPQRRLKCPFYQRQPEKYNKAACRGTGFVDMAKLKDHIKRVHTQPLRCSRCWLEMESDEAFSEHLQQIKICQIASEPEDDRIQLQMLKRLDFKKAPYSKARNVDEKWKMLYTVLFPDDSNMPSPYEQQGMSPQFERALCEALEEELTRELATVIGPIMTKIKGCIPAIIENCRQKLRLSSPSSDDDTISTPSGTSSVTSSSKTRRGNSSASYTPPTESATSADCADGFESSPGPATMSHTGQRTSAEAMVSHPVNEDTINPLESCLVESGADHCIQPLDRHDSFQGFQDCGTFETSHIHHFNPSMSNFASCEDSPQSSKIVRTKGTLHPCSLEASAPQQQTLFLGDDPHSDWQLDGMSWIQANITHGQPHEKHLQESDLTHDFLAAGEWWESLNTGFDLNSMM